MEKTDKILVIGALGEAGHKITQSLRLKYGRTQVIATGPLQRGRVRSEYFPYTRLDALNKAKLLMLVRDESITQIYLLPATLSAQGDPNQQTEWQHDMDRLSNVLDISVKCNVEKIYWPCCNANSRILDS